MAGSKWLRKPAQWIDRVVKERLEALTIPKSTYAIAVACTVMALPLPLTELVPLSTNLLSLGLVSYGIALVANDGLMAVLGSLISAATLAVVVLGLG